MWYVVRKFDKKNSGMLGDQMRIHEANKKSGALL